MVDIKQHQDTYAKSCSGSVQVNNPEWILQHTQRYIYIPDKNNVSKMYLVIQSLLYMEVSHWYWYMDKEKTDYIPASSPNIIVRKLTDENIKKAIETYLDDEGYWLKLYFLAGKRKGIFDIKNINKMIEEIRIANEDTFED